MNYIKQALKTAVSGEIQGGETAFQLPNVECAMVKIRALASNSGNVYLGGSGVTVPDGTTDETSGYELDAGQDTDWLPIDNLNRLYGICDNNGDDMVYIALR
jgi:hypothetical protein|tara:strand:+ start:11298 stop:11603 length:306 start_codon:yes stop_codon:yes gene_type:complete